MAFNQKSTPKPESSKRPYQAPRLVTYGDIRSMTQATGSMTDADGATMGAQKTA